MRCLKTVIIIIFTLVNVVSAQNKPHKLRVLAWNIWGKLNQDARYTTDGKTNRQKTIEIIKASKADVVVMIETYGSAEAIAKALNFHYYTPSAGANLCIFSRYPLSDFGDLKGISSFSFIKATVNISATQKVRFYPIWLTSGGRHINQIRSSKLSDEDFTKGDDLRHRHLQDLIKHADFVKYDANSDKIPVIVAGDFNCVSHLDYTEKTQKDKLNYSRILPIKVSLEMEKLGYTDTYRSANPKITEKTLGYTWTTVGLNYTWVSGKGFVSVDPKKTPRPESQGGFSRIDYIYSKGTRLKTNWSKTLTYHPEHKDKSFPYWPSDHGAVLTEFCIK